MKKMFTLFMGLICFSALFAQYDKPYNNRNDDDRNASYGNRNNENNEPDYRPDRAVTMHRDNDRWQPRDRMSENDRRREADRISRDYDRQADVYRNDRRLNRQERDYQVDRLQKEKAARLKNIGAGVLIGGILGVIIGSQL